MSDGSEGVLLERARDAASRGAWQAAFELFQEADANGHVGAVDLPVMAGVAYASGDVDVTIETWERAYAALRDAGETTAAAGAAVRVAMHLLFDTALMAPVRGWLARAEQLLDSAESTPPHAWLAVVRSYERMLSGDRSTAMGWARRAIEVGSTCDPAAAAIGRVAEARLYILDGEVERGLAMLDEAGTALVAGDLDPLSTGVVYCELVCALQGLAQYDLAEEWTEAMERWSHTNAIGSLRGRCRVHRAEIMRLRGRCREAEAEALQACDELRPYLRRELGWPLTELGRIRLRTGDLAGAEHAFVAAHRAGWDAQPGPAQLLLARGDVAGAASSIRDALERPTSVPSKELPPDSDLRRAPLLATQVEIAIADGDLQGAQAGADELAAIAARFQSKALIASAVQSRAQLRLALGDAPGAERLFTEAAGLWIEVGAPYEVALARIGLGDACRAGGNQHRAELEQDAGRAIIDEIRMPPAPGVTEHTNVEPAPQPSDGANAIQRIGDDWSVTFEGHTVHVRDRKGMHHLARLLTHPGREFHVLDLVAADQGNPLPSEDEAAGAHLAFGDAGEMLDASARSAYRRRLAEIDDDVEAARASGDHHRETQADAERDFLLRELSRAVGLGGRGRRAGSASERARSGVTRAIRQAMVRIQQHNPELGQHLQRTVRTGTYCVYLPDTRVPAGWKDR
jgi:tetratricopeptide (TPR) repeat protein